MREDKVIHVYYHDRIVGRLALTEDKRCAFEYSDEWLMDGFTKSGEEKWKALIEYGISTGEFHKVDTIHAIISHIRKQLIKEMDSNGV